LVSCLVLLLYAALAFGISLVSRWLRRRIAPGHLLAFALLPVALLPEAMLGGKTPLPLEIAGTIPPWTSLGVPAPRNPALSDVALQFVPWAEGVRLAYKAEELPWRDRWNGCGSPLAANGSAAAFSPFTIAGLLLPLAHAFTLLAAAKLLLAMAGMFLWTRELGASEPSACLAAVAFGLSFSVTAWLLFPQTAVLCLWPWMLFFIELGTGKDRLRASVGLVLCLSAMVLAGHPENVALGCLFAGLWLVARSVLGRSREKLGLLARTALPGLIAIGLTAWLLLPQFHAIAASNRYALLETRTWDRFLSAAPHGPAWAGGLLVPLLPFTFGDGIDSPMIPGGPSPFLVMGLAYIGILGWAVALLVFRPGSRRSPQEKALWLLLALGLAIAIGQWPFLEIVAEVPLLGLIAPLRFLSWIALATPAIAALELDRYRRDIAAGQRAWRGLSFGCLALAGLAVLVFAGYRGAHAGAGGLPFQSRQLLLACGLLAVGALAAFLLRRRPTMLTGLIVVLVAAELLYQARRFYRPSPPDWLFPETPIIQFLRSREGTFRVLGDGSTLFPGSNVFAGVADVRTHDPMERRDYVEFLDATCGYNPRDYFKVIRNLNAPALDFLNVRYLVRGPGSSSPGSKWGPVYAGADGTVFENSSVLPRAFAPRAVQFVPPVARRERGVNVLARFGAAIGDLAAAEDWREKAVMLSADQPGQIENSPVEISDYRESTNAISFRTARSSSGRSFVVLSVMHDGGWTARDETGRRSPVYWANGPFLAVEVRSGAHAVDLRYRPPGSRAGLFAALGTLAVLGVVFVLGAGRRAARRDRVVAV
jgi:hypothetical protein